MAHFLGTVRGNRGEASRLGSAASGLHVRAASWQGAVDVELYTRDGIDYTRVSLSQHHGHGIRHTLYDAPVDGRVFQTEKAA